MMKKITFSYTLFLVCTLSAGLVQCDKSVEVPVELPYPETSLDQNGGNWKTYLLSQSNEIPVPAPEAPDAAAYQNELAELKAITANLTDAQREAAIWWGGNGVLRWHEIARELAAQYNSAPKNNADGTYPVPDPANPTAYPRFPFANPPYASRAFALLAVAQYDALVAAWHYKFQYNRQAPYRYDNQIQTLIPENDLPSYPSEDAVVAAASREVMKFLFPGEKAYLDQKAAEHQQSRLWAGANVPSDLAAGDSLGRLVAAKVIAYAKTDRMGQANNQPGVQGLRDDATARGIVDQWKSLELPSRPPLLPFFGKVKTWNFNDSIKVAIRPSAPPTVGTPEFDAALNEMRDISKNRTAEQWRIAAYWADGTGSYTPPGHWNRTASELIKEKELNELRSARAMALVTTAIQDAGISCWDIKYYYLTPRPTQVDPSITTSTGIPNFPGYTSGHSTFSAAGAAVLGYLFPDQAAKMDALAKEASESRIYGCIHFRFDCEVGLENGRKVASYAIERGRNDGSE